MLVRFLPWLKKPQRTGITPLTIGTPRFLGEQDGPVERDLKARWLPILSATPQVRRAFLVRASYDGQSTQNVVLALSYSGEPDSSLMEALRVPFAAVFNREAHLDMVFVSAAQEAQIERVCPPFYMAV
jgi:hypothetical protein